MAAGLVLHDLDTSAARLGDSEEALKYFDRALAIRREIGDRQGEVLTLTNIGAAQLRMKAHDKSRATEEAALEMARKIGFRYGQALSLYYAAQTDLKLGERERARDRLIEAVALFQAGKNLEFESMALASLAGVELTANNLQPALEYSRLAVGISDSIRGKVTDSELRASFRAFRGGQYRLHVEVLMRLHKLTPSGGFDVLALETIERSRARSLVEMLGESHIDLRKEIPPEQRRREDQILDRINRAQRELFRAGLQPARKPEVKKELAAAEHDLDTFRLELHKSGSRYASVQYAPALGPDQIRRELLNPNTALIEYALGEQQSYVWVLTREGFISAALPPRAEIEGRVAAYRKELAQGASALTVRGALARLDALGAEFYHRDLLAPVETAFGPARRLIIVPDGALAYLPFETLGGKTRMIERFAVGYAPSASVLAALRSRSEGSSKPSRILLAFGDPVYTARGFDFTRLPNTRAEVTAIRSLYPADASRVYLGAEASEESVKGEQLDQYRFLHFAAHGYYDEEQPLRSGIVLSLSGDSRQDGVLQVPEIMRLRLRAEMVSLSACQTGLGKLLAGEGVMGLGRAFLFAGADSLLISLWNVNDASTATLMKRVYENINRGLPRDEALRQAKLSLLRSQEAVWRHPYYWAPFVLLGNPADTTVRLR